MTNDEWGTRETSHGGWLPSSTDSSFVIRHSSFRLDCHLADRLAVNRVAPAHRGDAVGDPLERDLVRDELGEGVGPALDQGAGLHEVLVRGGPDAVERDVLEGEVG